MWIMVLFLVLYVELWNHIKAVMTLSSERLELERARDALASNSPSLGQFFKKILSILMLIVLNFQAVNFLQE